MQKVASKLILFPHGKLRFLKGRHKYYAKEIKMSISQKVLRSLIREMLLKETPLIDMPVYPNSSPDISRVSVSHPATRSTKGNYEAKAKELMKNTKDNWVLITGNTNTNNFSKSSEDYEKWIEGKNYPPGTLVIFVDSPPMEGDSNTPIWQIVHDVFGHSIQNLFVQSFDKEINDMGVAEEIGEEVAQFMMTLLPKEYQIVWNSEFASDALPTVLGAIFTEKLKRQRVNAALPELLGKQIFDASNDEIKSCVDIMFRSVEEWTQNLRNRAINAKGGVKVNFISPW